MDVITERVSRLETTLADFIEFSKATIAEIRGETREFLGQMREFREQTPDYFPEERGKEILPVFSSLHIRNELVTQLTRAGIYAMEMGDETMQLINKDAVSRR